MTLTILLLLLCSITLNAQNIPFVPPTYNYSSSHYNAGNQNWAVDQGVDGVIYIANNDGLLTFDGVNWDLLTLPNNLSVKSILIDNHNGTEKIYIGSFEEFGYFERNSKNRYIYHSLKPLLKDFEFRNDEIWTIRKHGNNLFFQTFSSFFVLDENTYKINSHKLYPAPLYFFSLNNELYAQYIDEHIYKYNGSEFIKLLDKSRIKDDVAVAILPYEDSLLLFSSKKGIYLYDSTTDNLTEWKTEIDSELANSSINRVILLQDTTFIIGTLNNGIYAIDKYGNLQWHLNRSNGLLNNTVLGLFTDKQNNVWAALDNGLSYIYTSSAISFYEPIDSQIGMVTDILVDEEEAYLATNQGIYIYSYNNKDILQLPDAAIQSWYIHKFDDQIITGNNFGTSFINNGAVVPISEGSTGGMDIKQVNLYGKDILLESTYNDLQVYKNNYGKWVYSHKIAGFSDLINQIEVDHSGNIWAAHMYKGIYKLRTDTELRNITQQTYYSKLDRNSANNSPIRLMKLKGRIVFTDRNMFYTYDDLTDKIIPFDHLNNDLKGLADTHKIVTVDDSTFWFIRNNEYNLIYFRNNRYASDMKIPFTSLNNPPIKGQGNVYVGTNGVSYFSLNGGIGRFIEMDKKTTRSQINLVISSAWSFDRKKNFRNYLDSNNINKIPYPGNNISFKLQYPDYLKTHFAVQCQLIGYDNNWIDISDNLTVNYTNLPAGKYKFDARVLGKDEITLSTLSFQFEIKNPWYITGWAKTSYILIFTFLLLWFINEYLNRIIQRKNRLFTELEKERVTQLEKQKTLIAHLKNQQLETDLSYKSKELANATMLIINNEELLSNLKSTIQKYILDGKFNRVAGTKLVNLIDENLSDDDEWTLFQENFDLIHENFFRKLKQKYPSLTPSDLRLCTLLRLNYSTKEIARMLNLTPRGVEAARYRLRKKLLLDGEISLIEFMINFK